MGVIPVEIPKGSGKWWVRINWTFGGRRWRKTKLVGTGETAKDSAFQRARHLNEAHQKFGVDVIKLVDPELPKNPESITVNEYSEKFIKRAKTAGLKRSTIAMYESNLKYHVLPVLGNIELRDINYGAIADFLSGKAEATYSSARFRKPEEKEPKLPKAKRRPYSRNSLRIMAMTVRALMAEAVKDGIIAANPITGLSRFYRKRKADRTIKRFDVFTIDELHAIEAVIGERFLEYYEFTLAMSREGMRIGEAAALLVSDIDFSRGTIQINKNIPAGIGHMEESAKTESSDREIEFWSQNFRYALEAMLTRRREECFAKGASLPDILFSEFGHSVNYSRYVKTWNRAQRLAGVRQRSPHYLRHTWASHQIAAGEDIASVSKHLGHANPGITLQIYTHFLPGKRRTEGNVLDSKKLTKKEGENVS
jgi:integrase